MPDTITILSESNRTPSSSYDPFLRGIFAVGVRSFEARDQDRNRLFPCEVWYPAAPHHAGQDLDPETQDHFTPRLSTVGQKQSALRDSAAFPGSYPLVIFSHHSGGHRRASSFLCTHLASHGYIVGAVDHSEVIAQELARPQSESEEQKKARWQAVMDSRVPDVRFLIDYLLQPVNWNSEAKIDRDRIAIAGHSFGAWTALAAPEVDQRVQAVVALAPGGASKPRPGILPVKLTFLWDHKIPTLFLVAENDVPLPLSGMYELFERAPAPKQMVILRRADHLHFVDNVEQNHEAFRTMPMPPEVAEMQKEMLPISELCSGEQSHLWIRGLTLAHMDAVLKSRDQAREFLAADVEDALAKHGVEVILHKP